MKNISVSIENLRKIRKLKKELGLKHNNDVISYLFGAFLLEEKTNENDDIWNI